MAQVAADAGLSMTHMSMAFSVTHPAVTSAIIGPRTMEQLTDVLAGSEVELTDDVLDALDKIVPPGVTINAADAGWTPPSISQSFQRRRPAGRRAAS